MEENQRVKILGHYGGLLSAIEVGLGSLLHSLHVPFAGIFLSLNQGYLLCRVAILTRNPWTGYSVSNIAAVLKSLAPAGKKLGPMLSLSMQGLLFNLGTLFGVNPFGLSLGMILLSFWSFVQPVITYYLFFGDTIVDLAKFIYEKSLPYGGEYLLYGVIMAKALTAVILAMIAWKNKGHSLTQDKFLEHKPLPQKQGPPLLLALKDLAHPLFLLSLLGTGIFLYFSHHSMSEIIWKLMRPLALGFIFFYFSRTLTLDKWLKKLHGGKWESFALGCEEALKNLRKIL